MISSYKRILTFSHSSQSCLPLSTGEFIGANIEVVWSDLTQISQKILKQMEDTSLVRAMNENWGTIRQNSHDFLEKNELSNNGLVLYQSFLEFMEGVKQITRMSKVDGLSEYNDDTRMIIITWIFDWIIDTKNIEKIMKLLDVGDDTATTQSKKEVDVILNVFGMSLQEVQNALFQWYGKSKFLHKSDKTIFMKQNDEYSTARQQMMETKNDQKNRAVGSDDQRKKKKTDDVGEELWPDAAPQKQQPEEGLLSKWITQYENVIILQGNVTLRDVIQITNPMKDIRIDTSPSREICLLFITDMQKLYSELDTLKVLSSAVQNNGHKNVEQYLSDMYEGKKVADEITLGETFSLSLSFSFPSSIMTKQEWCRQLSDSLSYLIRVPLMKWSFYYTALSKTLEDTAALDTFLGILEEMAASSSVTPKSGEEKQRYPAIMTKFWTTMDELYQRYFIPLCNLIISNAVKIESDSMYLWFSEPAVICTTMPTLPNRILSHWALKNQKTSFESWNDVLMDLSYTDLGISYDEDNIFSQSLPNITKNLFKVWPKELIENSLKIFQDSGSLNIKEFIAYTLRKMRDIEYAVLLHFINTERVLSVLTNSATVALNVFLMKMNIIYARLKNPKYLNTYYQEVTLLYMVWWIRYCFVNPYIKKNFDTQKKMIDVINGNSAFGDMTEFDFSDIPIVSQKFSPKAISDTTDEYNNPDDDDDWIREIE